MKTAKHIMLVVALAALGLAGCSESEGTGGNVLSRHRVWSLRKMTYPGGYCEKFPNGSGTFLSIADNDSTIFTCHWAPTGRFTSIMPQEKIHYTLINKGGGEYVYFHGGNPHPLQVVNDTTINVQTNGIVFTWSAEHGIDQRTLTEISVFLASADYGSGSGSDRYVFTQKEHELEDENHLQLLCITVLVAALAAGAFFLLRTYRNKRRMEAEVRRLQAERQDRPQLVAEALKNVEAEWLASDEYARLRKLIERGTLTPDDWAAMERQLNKVYPSFTHTLEGLYRMSQLEHRVCMLIKLRATPSEMAAVLNKEASTISTTRSRLYYKITGKKGGAKDWDEFVLEL
ncbi:MAG: hypothetical protein HUK02_09955 [Bacteroidaceae bacterium]|nr:hypothetical protein [Bacteroidaceae bacterium]